MDEITIKDLIVFAKHGVLPEETVLGQKFLVSLHIFCDTRKAGMSDDLRHSMSYAEIAQECHNFLTENTFKLIEACAEGLARHLLLLYHKIRTIEIEIKKPWAPIGLDLDTVSVKISRSRHLVYAALGSNLGDKEGYLREAIQTLDNHPDCRILKISPLITTAPYGSVEQEEFLNGALLMETLLTPTELLALFKALERQAKRETTVRWGPRTLDLDILFYDDLVYSDDTLTIPHRDIANREFVLEPMCAIAPDFVHPRFKLTMSEMLERVKNS